MSHPGNYLRRAEEAEAQAQQVACPTERQRCLELASLWRQVAADLDQVATTRPRVAA